MEILCLLHNILANFFLKNVGEDFECVHQIVFSKKYAADLYLLTACKIYFS